MGRWNYNRLPQRYIIAASISLASRATHGTHQPGFAAAAGKLIASVRFEPRHKCPGRHFEALQHITGFGIDVPHIAVVSLPRTVPQLAINSRHTGYKSVR